MPRADAPQCCWLGAAGPVGDVSPDALDVFLCQGFHKKIICASLHALLHCLCTLAGAHHCVPLRININKGNVEHVRCKAHIRLVSIKAHSIWTRNAKLRCMGYVVSECTH